MEAQSLLSKIWLPHPRDAVFSFLSDPRNLETTTPSWLRFSVLAPQPIEMRAGLLIDYRLRLHGFPFRWRSEITVWDPPNRFAEEQRRGPYRRWAHLHTFEENNGGTLCYDTVDYAALGGRLIEWLFVRHHVERIFQFRRERLAVLFA